jgi:cytosine/adenosine deaminase-related metal-dependent hydrolase
VDVTLDGGTVSGVFPAGPAGDRSVHGILDSSTLDLRGFLLLTAPAEPHAHLDKALSWDLIDPPMGDLDLAIESWREYTEVMTVESIADRAREAALLLLRQGTTAVRTHVDMLVGVDPMRGVRALVRVRDELRELMDIELVALAGPFVPSEHIEEALRIWPRTRSPTFAASSASPSVAVSVATSTPTRASPARRLSGSTPGWCVIGQCRHPRAIACVSAPLNRPNSPP